MLCFYTDIFVFTASSSINYANGSGLQISYFKQCHIASGQNPLAEIPPDKSPLVLFHMEIKDQVELQLPVLLPALDQNGFFKYC